VIAVDTNILVYAHRRDSIFHERARACLAGCAQQRAPWALPWPCLHEFYGVATHPRIYQPPTSPAAALDQIEAWLESPSLVLLTETDVHWPALKKLLGAARVQGGAVHDARIAALCVQHRVSELWSADRDFSRYPALKVKNPLVD
jgi:toxin-antitoxin system PIN domain toxin